MPLGAVITSVLDSYVTLNITFSSDQSKIARPRLTVTRSFQSDVQATRLAVEATLTIFNEQQRDLASQQAQQKVLEGQKRSNEALKVALKNLNDSALSLQSQTISTEEGILVLKQSCAEVVLKSGAILNRAREATFSATKTALLGDILIVVSAATIDISVVSEATAVLKELDQITDRTLFRGLDELLKEARQRVNDLVAAHTAISNAPFIFHPSIKG